MNVTQSRAVRAISVRNIGLRMKRRFRCEDRGDVTSWQLVVSFWVPQLDFEGRRFECLLSGASGSGDALSPLKSEKSTTEMALNSCSHYIFCIKNAYAYCLFFCEDFLFFLLNNQLGNRFPSHASIPVVVVAVLTGTLRCYHVVSSNIHLTLWIVTSTLRVRSVTLIKSVNAVWLVRCWGDVLWSFKKEKRIKDAPTTWHWGFNLRCWIDSSWWFLHWVLG